MKWKIEIIIILLIVVVALLFINLAQLKSEGLKCQTNPLVYGADKLSEYNKFDFTCSCRFMTANSPVLLLTRYNLTLDKTFMNSNSNYFNRFNWSMLK